MSAHQLLIRFRTMAVEQEAQLLILGDPDVIIRSHFLRHFGLCVITIRGLQIVLFMETHQSHSRCRRSLIDMSMCRSPGGPCTIPGSDMGLSRTDSHLRELGTLLNNA